jgi:hypothetical protein
MSGFISAPLENKSIRRATPVCARRGAQIVDGAVVAMLVEDRASLLTRDGACERPVRRVLARSLFDAHPREEAASSCASCSTTRKQVLDHGVVISAQAQIVRGER